MIALIRKYGNTFMAMKNKMQKMRTPNKTAKIKFYKKLIRKIVFLFYHRVWHSNHRWEYWKRLRDCQWFPFWPVLITDHSLSFREYKLGKGSTSNTKCFQSRWCKRWRHLSETTEHYFIISDWTCTQTSSLERKAAQKSIQLHFTLRVY